MLQRRGIERVRPLAGGFEAWREQGLPVEGDDGEAPPTVDFSSNIPADLGESAVLDVHGASVTLSHLWATRPAVLVFVRQFGCVLCRELVLELREHAGAIHEAGAELIVVGNGSPDAGARFRRLFDLDFPVFVDPHRHVYTLLGFRRNLGGSANPMVLLGALRAWLRGARQGRTQGDPWQLGGVLIVQPGGEVAYHYESRHAGDHPDPKELLARVRDLA